MKVQIRSDSITIEGYVNAVERVSKTLEDAKGKFVEIMRAGTFQNALSKNDDVKVLLDHNDSRELATTKDGTCELVEDSIGLLARATIKDKDVIESAKRGDLKGWSFGFIPRKTEIGTYNDLELRSQEDIELLEVSIIDRKMEPAYAGTSINYRSLENEELQVRSFEDKVETEQLNKKEEAPAKEKRGVFISAETLEKEIEILKREG